MEERHYLPVGVLLLPGILFAINQSGRVGRTLGVLTLAVLGAYGVASFGQNAWSRASTGTRSDLGFMHTTLDRDALNELQMLDRAPAGSTTVFYVTAPEIALEVKQGRPLCVPADWWSDEFLEKFRYAGRVPRLILVLPRKFSDNGKRALVERQFPDYRSWVTREVGHFLFVEGS
jgi:hypothetical protein